MSGKRVFFQRLMAGLTLIASMSICPSAGAATYANTATTFSWIDASTHPKVGYNTLPYKFNGTVGTSACGTTPPVIDDTISDAIPLGFNFFFGDRTFDKVRIMTNGRLQFVNTAPAYDNTTCGFGSPVTQIPIPNAGLNYTLRIFGNDLDPTLQSETTAYVTSCVRRSGTNACYISYKTLGSAPNRQFVVTWNNVPEWTATSTTTGNYNIQVILQENGEFIYQYGTDIPGPGALTGQVGWQVSTTDYEAPSVGYPQQNTAIRYYTPRPVIEYRMEQSSWSGAGQVIDSSASGRHGSPVGTTQPTTDGKVCRGAAISGTGNNAIDTGTTMANIGNAGMIAFWYKSNTAWSGGGTQDAQLFDATTVNGQWFFMVRRGGTDANAGKLRFIVTDNTGALRVVETPALTVAANTWKHIAVTWNLNNLATANNDKLTIYVDGVQQAQTAFTSTTTTLSPQIGTLYLGGNRAGLVGQNGTSNSLNGVLDEVNVYNYAAPLAKITQVMNQVNTVCMHHYSISTAGSAPACQPPQVTITAHTKEHLPFTTSTSITVSTSDNTGTWSLLNGRGTLTPGPNGTATYNFVAEPQVVLALTRTASASPVTVSVSDGVYGIGENAPLTVTACGTGKFNACEAACTPTAASNGYAQLYTKLAPNGFNLNLVALTPGGTLDATFSKPVTINLLANTNPPTLNTTTNCPTAQNATIAIGTPTFAAGRATVAVPAVGTAYRDVRVQFVCSAANCGTATTVCATDAFAIRPASFTPVLPTSADAANGSNATATPTTIAGNAFTIVANTATAGYDTAPNVDAGKVEWPGKPANGRPGTLPGTLLGWFATPAVSATGDGAQADNLTYDEVGYFRLAAAGLYDTSWTGWSGDVGNGDCIANSYSNVADATGRYGCVIANQAATTYLGRFIPHHFDSVLTPACTNAGGNFTYSGQAFKMVLSARNLSGAVTQNYADNFAKAITLTDANAVSPGTLAPANLPSTAFAAGTTASTDVTFTFDRSAGNSPPGTVKPRATDADAVSSSLGSEGTQQIRIGRLWIGNAYGPVGKNLVLPFQLQYWNGQAFVINAQDTCTALTAANFGIGNHVLLTPANIPVTAINVASAAGGGSITIAAPNVSGSVDVVAKLGATLNMCPGWTPSYPAGTPALAPWLRGRATCATTFDRDPVARATFGIFGESAKKGPIYIRENH